MRQRAQIIVPWLISLTGSAVFGASYWYYAKSASRYNDCRRNLSICQRLAADIGRIRQSPRRAVLATRSMEDLGTTVEKAAADSQLSRDRVLRIDPQPAKRLGKSDYLEQNTEIELLAVSLRQLVDFLYNVTRNDAELEIGTIRLRVPHDSKETTGQELWLADVILAQRIYAPITGKVGNK